MAKFYIHVDENIRDEYSLSVNLKYFAKSYIGAINTTENTIDSPFMKVFPFILALFCLILYVCIYYVSELRVQPITPEEESWDYVLGCHGSIPCRK